MFNKILIILTLLSLATCSKAYKKITTPEQSDLTKVFEIPKDDIEKFKVEKAPAKVTTGDEKKVSTIVVKKQEPAKVKSKKQRDKVEVQEVVPVIEQANAYPADYPDEFKKYDERSVKFWKEYKPKLFVGEKFHLSIKYLGVTAGKIELETMPSVMISGKRAYHIMAKMKSAEYYQYIYSLEDRIDTYVDEEDFLPLKYQLEQRESGQSVDDLQLFDHEKMKTSFWYRRLKKGAEKKEQAESYIPRYFQDSFSALYFARGFPYHTGDVYHFPVITRGKIWLLKATVDKVEEIEVADQKISAIRVKAETQFPGVLKKRGDILFWISNDNYRKILKFSAKVKIGSIEGELTSYEAPKEIHQ